VDLKAEEVQSGANYKGRKEKSRVEDVGKGRVVSNKEDGEGAGTVSSRGADLGRKG